MRSTRYLKRDRASRSKQGNRHRLLYYDFLGKKQSRTKARCLEFSRQSLLLVSREAGAFLPAELPRSKKNLRRLITLGRESPTLKGTEKEEGSLAPGGHGSWPGAHVWLSLAHLSPAHSGGVEACQNPRGREGFFFTTPPYLTVLQGLCHTEQPRGDGQAT